MSVKWSRSPVEQRYVGEVDDSRVPRDQFYITPIIRSVQDGWFVELRTARDGEFTSYGVKAGAFGDLNSAYSAAECLLEEFIQKRYAERSFDKVISVRVVDVNCREVRLEARYADDGSGQFRGVAFDDNPDDQTILHITKPANDLPTCCALLDDWVCVERLRLNQRGTDLLDDRYQDLLQQTMGCENTATEAALIKQAGSTADLQQQQQIATLTAENEELRRFRDTVEQNATVLQVRWWRRNEVASRQMRRTVVSEGNVSLMVVQDADCLLSPNDLDGMAAALRSVTGHEAVVLQILPGMELSVVQLHEV